MTTRAGMKYSLPYLHEFREENNTMAVTKKIEIDGNPVEFKASAAIPRIYRNKFGRDVYKDLMVLNDAIKDQNEEASMLDGFSLEMFEDLAFVMWSAAHPDQKYDSPDEWLDQFNTFSIYQILPELIDLWGMNIKTTVPARKN
jgi:hypothetical protein